LLDVAVTTFSTILLGSCRLSLLWARRVGRGLANSALGGAHDMRAVLAALLLVAFTACASHLSPLQERAWDAFNDCKQKAPSAVLNQIYDDGRLSYTAREGDIGIMQRCLQEKFGYR
jgi:hypothetical protein